MHQPQVKTAASEAKVWHHAVRHENPFAPTSHPRPPLRTHRSAGCTPPASQLRVFGQTGGTVKYESLLPAQAPRDLKTHVPVTRTASFGLPLSRVVEWDIGYPQGRHLKAGSASRERRRRLAPDGKEIEPRQRS